MPTNRHSRRSFLTTSGAGLAGALLGSRMASGQTAKRPNIVFIFADDLGWSDVGCNGARYYETPNIDRLARQGIRFTEAYMNAANCAPSRAALYSGQYGPRTGMYCVAGSERGDADCRTVVPPRNAGDLPLDKVTLGQALQAGGYRTALFGKWHLGYSADHHPTKRGFDEGVICYKPTLNGHWAPKFQTKPDNKAPEGTYLGDYLTDLAVDFLERHKGDDKPFLLNLNQFLVHGPLEAPADLVAKYEKKKPDGGDDNPIFAAMVERFDHSVGRVLAKLDELGLADDTMVLLTSDNGGVGGYRELGINGNAHTSNRPLKGGKTQLYEGGTRVPFVVRWPGVVKPGSETNTPVMGIDLYPTFCDLAETDLPKAYTLDGLTFGDVLRSSGAKTMPERDLFWHFPAYAAAPHGPKRLDWRSTPQSAIRSGDFKLIHFYHDDTMELYDVRGDMSESRELSAEMPEKVAELRARLDAWRTKIKADIPFRKPGSVVGESFDCAASDVWTGLSGVTLNKELAALRRFPEAKGVFVFAVASGSPAAKAGLDASDIISEIDGTPIASLDDWMTALSKRKPGDTVKLTMSRWKTEKMALRLGSLKEKSTPSPEATGTIDAKLVGEWIRHKGESGTKFTLKQDGTFEVESGAKGQWRVDGKAVWLQWKGASTTECMIKDADTFVKVGSKDQWRRTKD